MVNQMLAVRGGSVVDGSGSPPFRADILVDGERIVAVGPDATEGSEEAETLDASGLVVAPGFIDLHTHYDAQICWDPTLSPSCWHGVTTVVAGNCGYSVAPVVPEHHELIVQMLEDVEDMSPETLRAGMSWEFETFGDYLRFVERRNPYLNWSSFVGHSALRIAVLGEDAYSETVTAEQIDAMAALARDALADGAVGVATTASPGGRNPPTRYSSREEVLALVACLSEAGHGVGAFVPGGDLSLASLYELQPRAGRPFTWTALLASDDGSHNDRVAVHRQGRATGAAVHPQVSCRKIVSQATLAGSTILRSPAMTELARATLRQRLAAYRDPDWRRRVRGELELRTYATWDRWSIAESERHPELIGVGVLAAAARKGTDPLSFVLDLALEEQLRTRFEVVVTNGDEAGVRDLLNLEGAVLGLSDAGAHINQLCDAVLPTDLLGGWVRDRQALQLEQAVRKLSGELADLLDLPGRGYLREGFYADLVVFDPATVGPGPVRRVRDFPGGGERLLPDAPTGVAHILVNGTPIVEDGISRIGALERGPGRVIRSAPRPDR